MNDEERCSTMVIQHDSGCAHCVPNGQVFDSRGNWGEKTSGNTHSADRVLRNSWTTEVNSCKRLILNAMTKEVWLQRNAEVGFKTSSQRLEFKYVRPTKQGPWPKLGCQQGAHHDIVIQFLAYIFHLCSPIVVKFSQMILHYLSNPGYRPPVKWPVGWNSLPGYRGWLRLLPRRMFRGWVVAKSRQGGITYGCHAQRGASKVETDCTLSKSPGMWSSR